MLYRASRSNSSGQSTRIARAPPDIGASKNPMSRVKPPTVSVIRSTGVPAVTPRYFGVTTVTSHPRSASAGGNAPSTSASPPVFENGKTSDAIWRTERLLFRFGEGIVQELTRFDVLRLHARRCPQIADRLVRLSLQREDATEQQVRAKVLRFELQRFSKFAHRVRHAVDPRANRRV